MIRWPGHLERQLAARLRRRQRLLRAVILEHLAQLQRQDADGTLSWLAASIRSLVGRIRQAFQVVAPLDPGSLLPTARAVDAFVTAGLVREIQRQRPGLTLAPPIPLQPVQSTWVTETAGAITRMEEAVVERAVHAAELAALDGRDVAAAATEALETAETRAALAARDAVGRMQAAVGERRGPEFGSTEYVWRTQRDSRVRPAHRELAGSRQRWDDPHPVEGHPGHAFGCRCVAIPVRTP